MIETMLGEVVSIETKRKAAQHEAVSAAIGTAFSKGDAGLSYPKSLGKVLDGVKNARNVARGGAPQEAPNQDEAIAELRQSFRGRKRRKQK